MKGIEYTRRGEARRRLLGTVILFEGELSVVREISTRRLPGQEPDIVLEPGRWYGRRRFIDPAKTSAEELTPVEREYLINRFGGLDDVSHLVHINNISLRDYLNRQRNEDRGDNQTGPFDLHITKHVGDSREDYVVPMSDDRIDLAPFKLGYVRFRDQWYYSRRVPGATYSQGLHRNCVRLSATRNDLLPPNLSTEHLLSPPFQDMVKGRYPSFEESLAAVLDRGETMCAFSRDIAVSMSEMGRVSIIYKNKMIADTEDVKAGFRLGPRYKFMKEELTEKGVVINEIA